MSIDYEKTVHPNKTYGLPHGASNPSQAALRSQQHQAKTQTKIINGGKKIVVPSFHGNGRPTTPYDANHISRTTNHTTLQTAENGKYDHMVNAPPKQIPVSQVRGGKRGRRSRRRLKTLKSRRRSRRKHRSKSGKSRSRRRRSRRRRRKH
jgi:hypothetical protein